MSQILLWDTVWCQFVRCCGYIFVVKAYTVVRKVYAVSQGCSEVTGFQMHEILIFLRKIRQKKASQALIYIAINPKVFSPKVSNMKEYFRKGTAWPS